VENDDGGFLKYLAEPFIEREEAPIMLADYREAITDSIVV